MNKYKVNKREREFRDSGSIANNKICFEVQTIALRLRLHTEGFLLYHLHRTSPHRAPPLRIWVIQYGSTQLLSQTTTSTQEARHNNDHLYTQRDGHLAKQQSPHTRGIRHLANTPTITSKLRGIPTKLNSTSTITSTQEG